jgi:hypothetical protein
MATKKKKNADGTTKTRVRFTRRADRFKVWRNVSASTAANAADLPQTAIPLAALDKVLAEADQIGIGQAAFQASSQQASQRLVSLLAQGDKLVTVLKVLVKQHYGSGSDKLVEFGIQPFRARPKPTVVAPTTPPPPEAGAPAATPAPTTIPLSSK